jgi:hypothetical protein
MVLNHNCIRDILLEIEQFSSFNDTYEYNPNHLPVGSHLSHYDSDTVLYHIRQCDLAGYLFNTNWKVYDYVAIEDLNPIGHELVANIKTEEKWNLTKKLLSKLGGAGLKMMSATAEGVATAFLNKYMASIIQNL